MSDSVRPHRRQPTRLPRPWDSPGKNTAVGCHFLLRCMKVKSEREVAQSCPTLSDPMDCSLPGSSFHGIFQARVLEWGATQYPLNICFSSISNHSAILLGSPESMTGNTHNFFSYFFILYQDSMSYIMSCTMSVEKATAPHSSTLAWKIQWTGEPGGLPSMWLHRVRQVEAT